MTDYHVEHRFANPAHIFHLLAPVQKYVYLTLLILMSGFPLNLRKLLIITFLKTRTRAAKEANICVILE